MSIRKYENLINIFGKGISLLLFLFWLLVFIYPTPFFKTEHVFVSRIFSFSILTFCGLYFSFYSKIIESIEINLFGLIQKLGISTILLFNLDLISNLSQFIILILMMELFFSIYFLLRLMLIYEVQFRYEAPKYLSDQELNNIRTNTGESLFELIQKDEVLLIFVRHFGCVFCKETVKKVSRLSAEIEKRGLKTIFVHMSDPDFGNIFFNEYFKKNVLHISDPLRILYRHFKIYRGSILAIFGPSVWIKGVWISLTRKETLSSIEGDILQLGGFVIFKDGKVVQRHLNSSASETIEIK